MLNWLVYYPVERYLARHTDSLITINQEDYNLATTHRFQANEIKYISGVGVDTERFKPFNTNEKKQMKVSAGYEENDFLLFNAGEFNENKNQQFLLQSIAQMVKKVPNVRLLLAGEGILEESCKQFANKLGISHRVTFLGFRNDIDEIMPFCDVAVAASLREGLPVNIMEAMACELPIVAVDNRGHRELVHNDKNGWLITEQDIEHFAEKVTTLVNDNLRSRFGKSGRKMVIENYSTNEILKKKSNLYKAHMVEKEDVNWITP